MTTSKVKLFATTRPPTRNQWDLGMEYQTGEELLTPLEEAMCLRGWLRVPRTEHPRNQTLLLINERYGQSFGTNGKSTKALAFLDARVEQERQWALARAARLRLEDADQPADLREDARDGRMAS